MAVIGNNTAGRALPNISFFGSQSWTPSYTLQAYVYVIGGGGSCLLYTSPSPRD